MEEYCRLCGSISSNLNLILHINNIHKLKSILKIEYGDGLPQKSCDNCLRKTTEYIAFICTCELSYEFFQNKLLTQKCNTNIKEDLVSEESSNFKSDSHESSDSENISKTDATKPVLDNKNYDELIKLPEIENELCLASKSIDSELVESEEKYVYENRVQSKVGCYKDAIKRTAESKELNIKRKTDNENDWKCQYCPRTFTTDKILKRHIQNIHTNPNFKCIKCGFECTNKSNCAGHVKRKHFKDLNMEFEELLQFVLEKDSHTNDVNFSSLPFPCNCCTRSFAKETDLQKHKNRVHITDPDAIKLFGCKQCGSKYTYRKTAVKHIRNVHYERRTELVKAEIDEYLIQYGDPKREDDVKVTKSESNEETGEHECPVCHLKYSRAIILKSHFARFHLSEDEKKKRKKKIYLCQQCGKNFSARSAFKYHVQTHFGEKEFKCSECSKAYYTKHLLYSHMRKHTGDMSNRQLECEICHKRWPSKTALERHMNVHGQKQPRNYMCSICGNAFYSNYHLKSHMLRHTKENNFKCSEPGCNASFRADGSRKKHYYNFHVPDDQKPFSCDICQKKFFRKAYLADHLRKHGKAAECMLSLYRQKHPQESSNIEENFQ